MEHTDIELLLGRAMRHTGDERLPERPIIGPLREDSVDSGRVYGRFALGIFRHGHALPLHPCVEHPQDKVKDAMRAQCALWPSLEHRKVREDTCGELRGGGLDGNRRRCRLLCRCTPRTMASYAAY